MASSHGGTEGSGSLSTIARGGADTSSDEIDLLDYITVLWRRKYFVVVGTVLPSLLVFSISYFCPGDCRITYTYDIKNVERGVADLLGGSAGADPLAEPDGTPESGNPPEIVRATVSDRFYSDENLAKLAAKLKESGFADYAGRMSRATVQLEISGASLTMTVIGMQREDIRGISAVVRDNLERVIPMYFVKDQLKAEVAAIKARMADIEENEPMLELELSRKKAILARLKTLTAAEPGVPQGSVTLHLDSLPQNSEYLPLSYQVQAVNANIACIEETISTDREKCDLYGKLQWLDETLLLEAGNRTSSYYTIGDFYTFVTGMAAGGESSELKHHLSAYAKRVENVIAATAPVVDGPRVSPVPKDSLRKTGIVFLVLLMVTTFGAFFLEAVQKSRRPGYAMSAPSDGRPR